MSNRATEILKSRSATPARLPDFPEVMDSIAALDIQDAIIDGEIVALDEKGRSSFSYCNRSTWERRRPPRFFYAFDLLRPDGKNLQSLPIEERKAKLEELLKRLQPNMLPHSQRRSTTSGRRTKAVWKKKCQITWNSQPFL
jgi:ATP-dependent DNA ligase